MTARKQRRPFVDPTTEAKASPRRVQCQRLILISEQSRGPALRFEVGEQPSVVGSSRRMADWVLKHPTVSREHLRISSTSKGWLLEDLQSTNGTTVDGYAVERVYLRPGATLSIGDVQVQTHLDYRHLEGGASTSCFGGLEARSPEMAEVFAALTAASLVDSSVVLAGETGVGKSRLAKTLHDESARREEPFVVFNCGEIVPSLVESQLFGHKAGAFTGAREDRPGALEAAGAGTLFIDELDELALELQPRLLGALEDREFKRLGDSVARPVRCRIVSASQRDLWSLMEQGLFRADLFYRLAVFSIPVPPLRERPEDLPGIVDVLLGDGERFADLALACREHIATHSWPGNIRELKNYLERVKLLGGERVALGCGDPVSARPTDDGRLIVNIDFEKGFNEAKRAVNDAFERAYLEQLLERCDHNLSRASREAEMNRRHLYSLLDKHSLGRRR
ncbi:MAG: sigma 54-interacting transcriptional regulator [Myxococcota bacterium]